MSLFTLKCPICFLLKPELPLPKWWMLLWEHCIEIDENFWNFINDKSHRKKSIFSIFPHSHRSTNICAGTQIHKSNDGSSGYYLLYQFMRHIPGSVYYFSIQKVYTSTFSPYEIAMKVSYVDAHTYYTFSYHVRYTLDYITIYICATHHIYQV